MFRRLLAAIALAAIGVSLLGVPSVAAAGSTLWVNDNAATYLVPPGSSCTHADYPTIKLAVAAAVAAGGTVDTIKVCAGNYPEGVVAIPIKLALLGAQAGHPYWGRTFGGPNESTVTGNFTVNAPNVRIDGFSITNPAFNGITVKTAGNDARIVSNLLHKIGTATLTANAAPIYLENGPDRVKVVGNWIKDVQSVPTAQGVLIGDSTASDPSVGIVVALNLIEKVTSANGAYGVQANNGASTAATATGYTTAWIAANRIRDLNGTRWVHAIGLEGDTPNTLVIGNWISTILSPTGNRVAVYIEDDPSAPSVHVNYNDFDVTSSAFGMFVHPTTTPPGTVDGECNWWDSRDGPGLVGPGHGAHVYRPWLRSPAWGHDRHCGDHHGH
jgi:hypothetical protein